MKKYRLIKEYPGSPKLGTELTPKVDKENSNTNNFYWEGSWFNPKDFSEFWEEVIEKDYEIISYVAKDNPNNITTKRRGAHLHEEYWNIHSIKRLSDGEVFTVGDRIKVYEHGSIKTITEIAIKSSKALIKEGIWLRYGSGSSHLTHAIKVKNPIFLTHDDKDIFEGDACYVMDKILNYYKAIVTSSSIFYKDTFKYFLTEEAAQDYIVKNKVLFTTEDGVGIKRGDTYYFVDTDFSISLSNTSTGCGQYSERKYFSTYETAQYYVVVNAKVLSIEEFWEFVSKPGSNIVKQKALKRLVKERLNLK